MIEYGVLKFSYNHLEILMLITKNLFRLLGHFVPAAKDLRMACKLDFDEVADEWLKEVTPNVSTILFTYIISYFSWSEQLN